MQISDSQTDFQEFDSFLSWDYYGKMYFSLQILNYKCDFIYMSFSLFQENKFCTGAVLSGLVQIINN